MAPQHEEAGSVKPAANPAPSTSGAGTYPKTAPNASVRAASIHNAEQGDESDAENISYTVYGNLDPHLDWGDYRLSWESYTERKGLVHTILSKNTLEMDGSLAELENQGKFSTKIFTECLSGRPEAEFGSQKYSVKVLYR